MQNLKLSCKEKKQQFFADYVRSSLPYEILHELSIVHAIERHKDEWIEKMHKFTKISTKSRLHPTNISRILQTNLQQVQADDVTGSWLVFLDIMVGALRGKHDEWESLHFLVHLTQLDSNNDMAVKCLDMEQLEILRRWQCFRIRLLIEYATSCCDDCRSSLEHQFEIDIEDDECIWKLYMDRFERSSILYWSMAERSVLPKNIQKLEAMQICLETVDDVTMGHSRLRQCFTCGRVSNVKHFLKCSQCKSTYFCGVLCQKQGHKNHVVQGLCAKNMTEQDLMITSNLQKVKNILFAESISQTSRSGCTMDLDSEMMVSFLIDNEDADLREWIVDKQIRSNKWLVTRGDRFGSIDYTPLPPSSFAYIKSKFDVKIDETGISEESIYLYVVFSQNDSLICRVIKSSCTLEKKTRKAMNSFVRRKWNEDGREYTKVLQLSADIVDV